MMVTNDDGVQLGWKVTHAVLIVLAAFAGVFLGSVILHAVRCSTVIGMIEYGRVACI